MSTPLLDSVETDLIPGDSLPFDPGSYRDRTGRVLVSQDRIFRLLDPTGEQAWRQLSSSRFFRRAVDRKLLVPTWQLADFPWTLPEENRRWTLSLEHERIPFISYPYEWTWSMLREAALLHLELLLLALEEQLLTKDGSAYNIQWRGSQPLFIDVGSIEPWAPGKPWAGYRQFCQTFLFPLMLTAHKGIPFQPLLRGSLDGIEVGHLARAFGWTDLFKPGVLVDVWLHHQFQSRPPAPQASKSPTAPTLNAEAIRNNLLRLKKIVSRLRWDPPRSHWNTYAADNTYSSADHALKTGFITDVAKRRRWNLAWDIGCNSGEYSRLLAQHSGQVIALDADLSTVEHLFRALRSESIPNILPLGFNLADPSPGQGWRGTERRNLTDRGRPDLTLALALIHHLVIGANLPMTEVIDWFASLGGDLVIEFVGRDDPMVKSLLQHKPDHYFDYDQSLFEHLLARRFHIHTRTPLPSGTRTLYDCRLRSTDVPA